MSEQQRAGGVAVTLQQALQRTPESRPRALTAAGSAGEPAECSDCGGRGWVVVADGGAGTAKRCPCSAVDPTPRLEREAGIPSRYESCRLDERSFKTSGPCQHLLEAKVLATRWVDDFLLEGKLRGTGLMFIGPTGVGKTHLAVAALSEVIRRYRVRGRFVDFTTLIYQIQATFSAGAAETKQSVLDPVVAADVLVLDELGAHKTTPWVNEMLYLILNGRYTRRLPTLFTTNYYLEPTPGAAVPSPPEGGDGERRSELLSSRIPAMLVSRLWEMARPVVMGGDDYRRQVMRYRTVY